MKRGAGAIMLIAVVMAGGLHLGSSPTAAQTYDVPSFNTPYGENGGGIYFVLQDFDDPGVVATWRWAGSVLDVGVRGGLLDTRSDLGFLVGLDLKNEFVRNSDEFPFDVAWVSGVGIGWVPDDDTGVLRVPVGVSLGRETELGGGSTLTPYVYPRLGLDVRFLPDVPGADDTDTSLGFDIDFGIDWQWRSGYAIRFALTLGRNEAFGVGLAFW
jgi:hypothetical protein